MLVALDIGNTAVTYGTFKNGRLKKSGSILHNNIPKFIKNCSKNGDKSEINVVISSVVPQLTLKIKRALLGSKAKLWVVGENLRLPVKHRYRSSKQLGNDRILNIYGGLKMYRSPLLILDFGTAITADYLSGKGVFEGGMIIPGPEVAFQALIRRAARLPKKARLPEKSASFLGKTTYDCMKSGILEGYGAMIDGLAARFKARYGRNLKVLATGGFARHLRPYTKAFDLYDPLHSLKSLHLAYRVISKESRPGISRPTASK